MGDRYDVIVIGAGSAGLSAALVARRIGARVALVERGRIGGDCTWAGCVPSKALLQAAKLAHEMRQAGRFGLRPVDLQVDLGTVMTRVRAVIERVYQHETPEVLATQGVDVVQGAARFVDPYHIFVGDRMLQGERFVICTGASPSVAPIPGLAETRYLTYETIFELKE